MKMTAKASTVLNLLLTAALIYVWRSSQGPLAVWPVPVEIHGQAQEHQVAPMLAPEVTQARPFQWSQLLQSGNYRDFVANLRVAGCPESTVEDIVRGDAERAFCARRVEMNLDATQPGMWSVQSERELVDGLLGLKPKETEGLVAATSDYQPAPESATLAAFLQNVDFTPEEANQEQKQQIANLRQNLLEQIVQGSLQSQAEVKSAQSSQAANRPAWWRPASQSMLTAEQAGSMVGGLFGTATAARYDQYRTAHQSPQN